MNKHPNPFLSLIILGASLMSGGSAASEESKPRTRWAIAIHGGAGGDPAKWDQAKIDARKEGLERALRTGCDSLASGNSALATVEEVIRILEDDAVFNAGRGAVLTEAGRAELDASIMDGNTLECGAVAGVTTVKNPISLARRVMSETKHVLLVGKGADQFAKQQGVPLVPPDYFLSKRRSPDLGRDQPHFGTVGCVVLDVEGNLAAGTSTGGTSKKLPGRVGDSPIVGAGTYASNDSCAVSGTGIGEEYIRNAVAYDIAARMRYAGTSLESAVRVNMLQRLRPGVGGVIAISRHGEVVLQHNTPGMSCGLADSDGTFQTHLVLEDGVFAVPSSDGTDTVTTSEAEITAILAQQQRNWNEGNVQAFMEAYWRSPELTFSSGGEITRGYEATLARYKKRYPDSRQMGTLEFQDLEFLRLGEKAMQVQGTWRLDREEAPMSGRFTLVWRRLDRGWRIVHDHTSTLLPKVD